MIGTTISEIGDYDNDGLLDLMVKFDRATVVQSLIDNSLTSGHVTLFIVGNVNSNAFIGADTINVIE